ncbi:MAG: heavy metal translocating P-type ATPase metal-binding domain-containing protein [Cytophagaceae bacterium]|nr:heavy metal translocating P-type ATPase metal-binding domain-containing protein [Cytophagaceae bacterium]
MIQTADYKKVTCYHCGDSCDHDIYLDEKAFCCNGCKTVFEILNDHVLCDYYALENHPGQKIGTSKMNEYAFLDEVSIADQLLNFQEGNICGVTFYIPSVHCSSCIWLLEHLDKIQPGITRSTIVFQTKQLDLQFNKDKVSLAQIASLLERLGYRPEITLEGKPVNHKSVHKALLYKIGVAGFAFGNIMLLSIPEYVSFFGDFNGEFKTFFSYLSLILSLPVFFYSASDYFRSAWNAVKNKTVNIDLPIAIGFTAAFVQSLLEITSGFGMGYLDSLTGLIFFLLIGKWYQQKTYESISFQRDYRSYFPLATTVIKDAKEVYVALKEISPGDLILIRNQDVIPADSLLEKGTANIDYSFVTGESKLSAKQTGDRLFAGGRQSGESIQVRVLKKVSESYLTQLWNTDRSGKTSASTFVEFTNTVALYFTIVVLILSIGTYSFWYFTDVSKALHAAISVLIIFCPCTLALAIPFCFGNAMNILSKNGFYLKNTATIEKLTDIDTLVFDKTGTLTYAGVSDVHLTGSLTTLEEQYVKSLALHSGHPLSKLLYHHLKRQVLPVIGFEEKIGQGISGVIDGVRISIGSGIFLDIPADVETQEETEVYVRIDGIIKGRYTFKNIYRDGVPNMLRILHRKFFLHLLSGDTDSDKQMMLHYFAPAFITFQQSPADKLHYIKTLELSHRTLMIGDGLNDAGALLSSTCGVAVSDSSANFSPACDAILEAEQLHRLPDFIGYAKACVTTVRWSILISLFYNIIGLSFACLGLLKPLTAAVLMPLSSVSIVVFVTLISNLLAKKYKLK